MVFDVKVRVIATFGVVRRFHYAYDLFASGRLILLINKSNSATLRLTHLLWNETDERPRVDCFVVAGQEQGQPRTFQIPSASRSECACQSGRQEPGFRCRT